MIEVMKATRFRTIISNLLLILAYAAMALQWLWLLLVGLPPLIKNGAFDVLMQAPAPPATIPAQPFEASPVVWLLVGVVTLVILAVTIIVLIRLPRTILQTGERIVRSTSEAIVPIVTHHQPLPAKKRWLISRRVRLMVQLALSLSPLIISLLLPAYEEITRQIIVIIALWLAATSISGFVIGWLIAPVATSRIRSRASRG